MEEKNVSSRCCITVMFLLASITTASPSWSLSADLERLRARGVLRVAIVDMDIAPFVFRMNGELRGADVDLARGFAQSIGLEAVFVTAGNTYSQVVRAVAEGRADIGISELSKTMERAQAVLFSRPYFISGITLVVNRLSEARLSGLRPRDGPETAKGGRDDLPGLLNDPRHVIVTMGGSIQDHLMRTFFPSAVPRTTKTWQKAVEQVVAGKADAAVVPDRIHRLMVHHNPEVGYKARAVPLRADSLAVAVHPGQPDLLRLINDYLDVTEHQRETSLDGLLERYLGHVATGHVPPAQVRPGQDIAPDPEPATSPGAGTLWPLLAAMHAGAFALFRLLVVRRKRDKHWLLSPWAVALGMVLGGATGSLLSSPALFAGPLAGLFIRFWQLCVLPIMITAVVTSIYRLLVDGTNSALVRRMLVVLPGALLVIAALGVLLGAWGRPGADFPAHAQQVLIQSMPEVMEGAGRQDVFEQLMAMARSIVPGNVLAPVVHNQALAVLFIALFFGVMLTRCRVEARQSVVNVLDAVQGVFIGMVRASLYLLPAALYLLTLDFTARTGTEMLMAIIRLNGLMALALIPPLIFGLAAVRIRLRLPLKALVNRFLPMVLLAFSTRSSVVAMPLGMDALRGPADRQSGEPPGLDQDQAMAAFPLFLMACHCGFTIFFCLVPIFIGQVFQVEFTLAQYTFIVFGAALSALAATGALAMSHVLLLPIICDPLGLPVEPALLVGYALLTVMSPFSAAVQTVFSSGLTALVVAGQTAPTESVNEIGSANTMGANNWT